MKLSTSRHLERYPHDITAFGDKVFVLSSRDQGSLLEAYDAHLSLLWSKPLETHASAFLSVNQSLWVFDAEGTWECGEDGDHLSRVKLPPREGMRLSAIGSVADGFVFAWDHGRSPMRPPILDRVDFDGTVRWSITLPVQCVSHEGVVQASVDEGWKVRPMDPWTPATWFSKSSKSEALAVSGDAVLACFSDMPQSGIGYGYAVSIADGTLRFTTQPGPVSEVAALGGGAFLVGYQGYGAFETLRYEHDGQVTERWASHGYYLVGEDVRVIELENTLPSRMRLARLRPGGRLKKGERLDGYYTSQPLLRADGTAYFFRNGAVIAARDLSICERLVLMPADPADNAFSTRIVEGQQGLYLAYRQGIGTFDGTLVRIDLVTDPCGTRRFSRWTLPWACKR